MKRLTAIFATLALSTTMAVAQPHGPHQGPPGPHGPPSAEHHEQMLDHLTTALSLTDDQRAALERIHEARRPKIAPLAERMGALHQQVEAALERDADPATVGKLVIAAYKVRKKLEALHQEMLREADKVLTPDQAKKLRAMMEHHSPAHLGPR